eukprot:c45316_g1_i1 orf=47-235(+)
MDFFYFFSFYLLHFFHCFLIVPILTIGLPSYKDPGTTITQPLVFSYKRNYLLTNVDGPYLDP